MSVMCQGGPGRIDGSGISAQGSGAGASGAVGSNVPASKSLIGQCTSFLSNPIGPASGQELQAPGDLVAFGRDLCDRLGSRPDGLTTGGDRRGHVLPRTPGRAIRSPARQLPDTSERTVAEPCPSDETAH